MSKKNSPKSVVISRFSIFVFLLFASFQIVCGNNDVEKKNIIWGSDEIRETEVFTSNSPVSFAETDVDGILRAPSSFGPGQEEASAEADSATPVVVDRDSLATTLVVLVGVLLLVVLLLVFISANLINLVRVREGKESFNFKGTLELTKKLALNPYIATSGNFVVVIIALFFLVPQARSVGFQQGYGPDQPIKFSHALHAGKWEVDCKYCHTGTTKGKSAWIPSVNVCMNCHKAIKEGPKYGEKEIAKIYKAYDNNLPIEWVRVHNLPDLSYFNHQQHVVAGELECQQCHGEIEKMEVVYRDDPLSMGWCINCHRETEVRSEYYHDVLGRKDIKTVEDIGGLNCARCHY